MIKLNIQRFSSTNKTTHYELSQYVSSDLPTYLVDYNGDMSKIDTGINTAQTTADSASTAATNAATAAGTAQTTANTAVTNAATADGKATTANNNIGVMANLTTSEKTTLVGAINEVDANVGNLSSLETTTKSSIVAAINEVHTKENIYKLYNNPDNTRNLTITLNDAFANYDLIFIEVNVFEGRQNIIVISDEIETTSMYQVSFSSSSTDRRIGIKFASTNQVNIFSDDSGVGYIKAVYGCFKK